MPFLVTLTHFQGHWTNRMKVTFPVWTGSQLSICSSCLCFGFVFYCCCFAKIVFWLCVCFSVCLCPVKVCVRVCVRVYAADYVRASCACFTWSVVTFSPCVYPSGNRLGTGIAIRYMVGRAGSMDVEIMKMTVEDGQSKKSGMAWIAAMQKVSRGQIRIRSNLNRSN